MLKGKLFLTYSGLAELEFGHVCQRNSARTKIIVYLGQKMIIVSWYIFSVEVIFCSVYILLSFICTYLGQKSPWWVFRDILASPLGSNVLAPRDWVQGTTQTTRGWWKWSEAKMLSSVWFWLLTSEPADIKSIPIMVNCSSWNSGSPLVFISIR